jgi:hypothetical protein
MCFLCTEKWRHIDPLHCKPGHCYPLNRLRLGLVDVVCDAPNGTMNEWAADVTARGRPEDRGERENLNMDNLILSVMRSFDLSMT